ncbi:MBOAT, membrane-bound O-acyltransferase family-domain-containing protein [Blastocladiella britannica]|nr:MBOAT, membrane-bound O-acyltransferase family-domain-containing protein [Blastocladiella britannica]
MSSGRHAYQPLNTGDHGAPSATTTAAVRTNPSRWRTPEYFVYYALLATLWSYGYWQAYDLSRQTSPMAPRIRSYLTPGWLVNQPWMDNSDAQYSGFRKNMPILAAAAAGYLGLSWTVRRTSSSRGWLVFTAAFSIVFLAIAHGFHVVKILVLVLANYAIGVVAGGSRWNPGLTWAFNIAVLFASEWTGGFRFADIDAYGGIMRWNVTFNISILRLISFNMDRYWSHHQLASKFVSTHRCTPTLDPTLPAPNCCLKLRSAVPRPPSEYALIPYLAYTLYIPLYFAGPIVSFNGWMSMVQAPPPVVTRTVVIKYAARLVGAIALMEGMMHWFHVVAMAKAHAWDGLSPLQVGMVGFVNLKFIWLKLMIMWRFFRLWALADGMDPPENMARCVSNHYSTVQFWRDWHCSYNLWNIRYLYLPLGGGAYRYLNMWVIFTFVAVWHDLELRLLAWGWLICLFIVPEIVAKWAFRAYTNRQWYRPLAAFGATLNVLTMIVANLVGFAVGTDGMLAMLRAVVQPSGIPFLTGTLAAMYALVMVMFEVREAEARERARVVEVLAARARGASDRALGWELTAVRGGTMGDGTHSPVRGRRVVVGSTSGGDDPTTGKYS